VRHLGLLTLTLTLACASKDPVADSETGEGDGDGDSPIGLACDPSYIDACEQLNVDDGRTGC
jgi:hypothetical protein